MNTKNIIVKKNRISYLEIDFLLSGYGKHIFPVSISELKDEYILKHHIEGYVSLANLLKHEENNNIRILNIIIKSIKLGQEYPFDLSKIILNEKTIYISKNLKEALFLCEIGIKENMNEKIIKIFEIFEEVSSYENKKEIKKLKREVEVYNLTPESIIKMIERKEEISDENAM